MDPANLDDVRESCISAKVHTVIAAHGAAGSGELISITDSRIRQTMQINALSVIRLFVALREGLADRSGVFVTVSSQAGLEGEAQNAVYSAAKAALIGWTKSVAMSSDSPRMRVICPGMTETPLLVAGLTGMAADAGITYDEFLARRLEHLPSRRLGRPSEVARAIVWLTQLQTRGAVVAAITGGETF
jgi:NAD(P)-dependent dehydrogenase (short-subunit alcohol dehydrogenase family)